VTLFGIELARWLATTLTIVSTGHGHNHLETIAALEHRLCQFRPTQNPSIVFHHDCVAFHPLSLTKSATEHGKTNLLRLAVGEDRDELRLH